jgi:nicotinate-nucleotide adenylyltransferase
MSRLGIVGGAFDPVHLGHVAMAEAAADCARLDEVLLVPVSLPPHRPPATAPAADRLEMCRLAIIGHPRLRASDLELRRPGPSYTVDTLAELARERPDEELHLVLGWDAAREISSWRQPDQVMRLARLVIVTRPGWTPPAAQDLLAARIDPARAVLCDAHTPDIEATEIRRRFESGSSLDGLLSQEVQAYIRRRGLYAHTA